MICATWGNEADGLVVSEHFDVPWLFCTTGMIGKSYDVILIIMFYIGGRGAG